MHILCAVRDRRVADQLLFEMDDGEHCMFRIVMDGRAALESCLRIVPDVLVIDAVLPGMDGLGVVDCLAERLGDRMPLVIGGSMMPFSDAGFLRRGAQAVVDVPWNYAQLHAALLAQMEKIERRIDWAALQETQERACALLTEIGMHRTLKGFTYLAWAAALAYDNESRLYAVGRRLYGPIAQRFDTRPENVERLIRHAVESTMDAAKVRGVYNVFGNTIDPARGKPTNAEITGMLVQRMRVS